MKVRFHDIDRKNIAALAQETLWNEKSSDVDEAMQYLRETRGLSDDVIRSFRFGYYPQRLRREGHDWAGRLIMPLHDQHDNLVVLTSFILIQG